MTAADFKQAFPLYDVAMTSKNWKRSAAQSDNSRGRTWLFNFENPSTQEVLISLDYLNSKMIPEGCHKADVFYNIIVMDHLGNVLEKKGVSNKLAYGMVHFPKLKAGAYTVKVVNWHDTSSRADFLLSAYAADKDVGIDAASSFLIKDLNSANSHDIVAQNSKDGSVTGRSYLNNKTQDLTIELKKSSEKKPFDAQIKIMFQAEGQIPWETIKSNYEWQPLAKGAPLRQANSKKAKTSARMQVNKNGGAQ